MRLELVEYDFRVEYLKGKDNYVNDALSRITLKDPQNITGNIRKVTTRYKNRQKIRAENKEIELPTLRVEKASKPNVYEVISNDEVRKVVTLHVKDMLCLFKHGREITARCDVSDLYTNGILD